MRITEYRQTDSYRRWGFSYEGVTLVLLNEDAPKPYNSELLAFENMKLKWRISPQTNTDYDHIVNVWKKAGGFYAGSFSGFEHRFNYQTGKILETKFTK